MQISEIKNKVQDLSKGKKIADFVEGDPVRPPPNAEEIESRLNQIKSAKKSSTPVSNNKKSHMKKDDDSDQSEAEAPALDLGNIKMQSPVMPEPMMVNISSP